MKEKITGGCLCGSLRFECEGPATEVAHCHCETCRKASGAAYVTWITVPRESFAWTKGKPRLFRSSKHAVRGFCGDCGTQITFDSERDADGLDITVGSLDAPHAFPPHKQIYTRSKLSWLRLESELPAYPGEPPKEGA